MRKLADRLEMVARIITPVGLFIAFLLLFISIRYALLFGIAVSFVSLVLTTPSFLRQVFRPEQR